MCPPSIIGGIIWPPIRVIKREEVPIRTVCGNISSFWISFLVLINTFSVHPLIKRAAVIEHTVQNNLHSSSVDLCCQFCKKLITCFQILLICHTFDIFPCMGIIIVISKKDSLITIFYNPAVMWIHIIIILTVILMITWRNKNRI